MARELELLVLYEVPSRNTPGAGVRFVIVQRVNSDGVSTVLEKRGYYTADGHRMPGRIQALDYNDVVALVNNWKKAITLLKTPPAVPPPDPRSPRRDPDSEVPF